MICKPLILFSVFACSACAEHKPAARNVDVVIENKGDKPINLFNTIKQIPLPKGFERTGTSSNTFAGWLRNVSLKEDKTVLLYNGNLKVNQSAQFAVLNISVGKKDLQQCADAVMRLRAEYLYDEKAFDEIIFKDNANTVYQFTQPYTRAHFDKYLERVFGMCGSASLSKQLKSISINNIEAGDVFIRGGFPGHAVLVVDVAENKEGQKIYLLAQSYMPAQDIHILVNPNDAKLSPWYLVSDAEEIITPEYYFKKRELKRW